LRAYDDEEKGEKESREDGHPVEKPDHFERRVLEWKIEKDPEKIQPLREHPAFPGPKMEKPLSPRDLTQGFTTLAAEFCIIPIEGTAILAKHIFSPP